MQGTILWRRLDDLAVLDRVQSLILDTTIRYVQDEKLRPEIEQGLAKSVETSSLGELTQKGAALWTASADARTPGKFAELLNFSFGSNPVRT